MEYQPFEELNTASDLSPECDEPEAAQTFVEEKPALSHAPQTNSVVVYSVSRPTLPLSAAAAEQLLHGLFVRQALLQPDAVALGCGTQQVTYRKLLEQALCIQQALTARR